tara:strand:- start:1515 stop:1943 length:429 start_codon:yes stop_codon:yes gene_type:complete
MFSDKFNPDVMNEFKTSNTKRDNDKFQLKNIPYKIIIEDSDITKIKTTEDLVINTKKDNTKIDQKYNEIVKERKFKNTIKKKNNNNTTDLFLTNLTNEIPEDFEDIKFEFKSEFEKQENEIKEGRDKFNSILESLYSDGLLD